MKTEHSRRSNRDVNFDFGQGLPRLRCYNFGLLRGLLSRRWRRRPRALRGLSSRRSRFATDTCRVVDLFGSPFGARGRVDFFAVTRVVAFVVFSPVRVPLAALTSTCLPLWILLLLSVGHRVHLSKGLKDNKWNKCQSIGKKQLHDRSRKHSKV